jgi:hypothetical protein
VPADHNGYTARSVAPQAVYIDFLKADESGSEVFGSNAPCKFVTDTTFQLAMFRLKLPESVPLVILSKFRMVVTLATFHPEMARLKAEAAASASYLSGDFSRTNARGRAERVGRYIHGRDAGDVPTADILVEGCSA